MGSQIRFIYCTKEEYLKYVEKEKTDQETTLETSKKESSETIEEHNN